jgi:hypothetical protein
MTSGRSAARGQTSQESVNTSRGRGMQSGRSNINQQQKLTNKKTLQDYQYYLGSIKQPSDYKITMSYLINQIKKNYTQGKNIATALDWLENINLLQFKPTLQSSQENDNQLKTLEKEQFRIEFKTLLDVYIKREQTYQWMRTSRLIPMPSFCHYIVIKSLSVAVKNWALRPSLSANIWNKVRTIWMSTNVSWDHCLFEDHQTSVWNCVLT